MSLMKVVESHVKYLIVFPSITMYTIYSDRTVRSMRRSLSLGRRRTGSESRSAMELEEAAQVTYLLLWSVPPRLARAALDKSSKDFFLL